MALALQMGIRYGVGLIYHYGNYGSKSKSINSLNSSANDAATTENPYPDMTQIGVFGEAFAKKLSMFTTGNYTLDKVTKEVPWDYSNG